MLTAFLFLFSFWVYGSDLAPFIYVLFLTSLLVVIAFIDFNRFIILDSLILTGFITSLAYFLFFAKGWSFWDSILGLSFFGLIFSILYFISKGKWLGFGDVKLGLWLGFVFGLKNSVDIFYLTFLIGFIFAIILLSLKKAGLKTKVPLGSIMVLTSLIFLFSGFSILDLIDAELILRLWQKN